MTSHRCISNRIPAAMASNACTIALCGNEMPNVSNPKRISQIASKSMPRFFVSLIFPHRQKVTSYIGTDLGSEPSASKKPLDLASTEGDVARVAVVLEY